MVNQNIRVPPRIRRRGRGHWKQRKRKGRAEREGWRSCTMRERKRGRKEGTERARERGEGREGREGRRREGRREEGEVQETCTQPGKARWTQKRTEIGHGRSQARAELS